MVIVTTPASRPLQSAAPPTLAEALEAYLGVGSELMLPAVDYQRLVALMGDDAVAAKEELDAVLASLCDLPDEWKHESLAQLGYLAAARAKRLHPEFNRQLCEEIGRYYTWIWR